MRGRPSDRSVISKHPRNASGIELDPNDEFSYEAVLTWVKLADFYQFPFVVTFGSWEEMFALLRSSDLPRISRSMREFNIEDRARIEKDWLGILGNVELEKQRKKNSDRKEELELPASLEDALRRFNILNT